MKRSAFSGFEIAFVALDRNHDPDDEVDGDFDKRWALTNYDWLERAAKRAEVSQVRGNRDSAIVLSYSRQQINFESSNFSAVNKLSRDLAIQHKDAVSALRDIRRARGNPVDWTPSDLNATALDGQVLRLFMQNRDACNLLIDIPQIELLHARLCEENEDLDEDDRLDKRRVFLAYRSRSHIPSVDEYWPLQVVARHLNPDTEGEPKFRVMLIWRPNRVAEADRAKYVAMIRSYFPDARRAERRGVQLMKLEVASIEKARATMLEFLNRAEDAIGPAKGHA